MEQSKLISKLHKARKKQISTIFGKVPQKYFSMGLELASGDGFQSELLLDYIKNFTSSEYNEEDLNNTNAEITYVGIDAEKLDTSFDAQHFELIFSSNLLEHLPDSHSCISAMHTVLKDSGICVQVMPNPSWKIGKLLLFYPNLIISLPRRLFRKLFSTKQAQIKPEKTRINNPKLIDSKLGRLRRLFIPGVHGVSRGNMIEIADFRKQRWINEFEQNGFKIIHILKGPFFIGELSHRANEILEKMGFTTEYIYIAVKEGQAPDVTERYKSMFR